MSLKLKITNKYGQSITLTQNKAFSVAQVTGLTPPAASINTAPIATKDGSLFNSAYLDNRNIVILLYPTGNPEAERVNLYKYLKAKQKIRIELTTKSRAVYIDGYIESLEGDLYENPQSLQASIICPDPYFKAVTPIVKNFASASEEITNTSDEESGAVFEITASGAAENPTITNDTTGESFTVNYSLQTGDKITLNTRRGEKSLTLTRSGTTTNILNAMAPSSRWVNILPGANTISYTAASGSANLALKLTLEPIFEGI